MINIFYFIIGLAIGHIVSTYFSNKRGFEIKIDKQGEKVFIEPIKKSKQKVEFIGEATQKQIEEIERPKGLQKFFNKFAKPVKKEEDYDE